jgi:hypothetical protein
MVKGGATPDREGSNPSSPTLLHKPPTDRKEPQVQKALCLAADILWLAMWVFAVILFFLGMLTEEKSLLALMVFVILINMAGYGAFNTLWRKHG